MRIENLTLERPASGVVLENISFEVREGEFLSIIGTSGAGKTTLLKALAGLAKPLSGTIYYRNEEVLEPRHELGLVYQSYALFPWRTALQNVEFALELKGLTRQRREQMAREMLELVGLGEHSDKFPIELSGGMQQRVAMARELVSKPKVLMLDEGFSALDIQTRRELEIDVLRMQKELGMTVILVTHMVDQALSLSDRAIVLSEGKIRKVLELDGNSRPRNTDKPLFRKQLREVEGMLKPVPKILSVVKELQTIG